MNKLQANICLLAVTLCWSCEVIIHSLVPEGVNPFATCCVTTLLGALILLAFFARKIVRTIKQDGIRLIRRLVFLGVLSVGYNVLTLVGLEHFDIPSGTFTSSLTVVIIPVLMFIMRRRVGARAWISALAVFVGIALVVSPTMQTMTMEAHGMMTAACLVRAVFVVKLNDFAREHDPVALAAGVAVSGAVISFVPWCVMQPTTFLALPWSTELIATYFVFGYFIVAFAGMLNVFAQRRASAVHSTIIYSCEIIFTILWTIVLPNRIVEAVVLGPQVILGCALVVLGNVWEIMPLKALQPEAKDMPDEDGDEEQKPLTELPPHPLGELLDYLRSPLARRVLVIAAMLIVYLVISLPFKVLSVIPGFSDIRPVCMLMPAYGIFFGIPGSIVFGFGNVLSDIASDSLRWSSIAGFIGNVVYPLLLYLIWIRWRDKPFSLRTGREVLAMVGSIVLCAAVETAIIAPTVAFFYPEVDIAMFTISCMANLTVFPIAFAIPFMIFIQEELGFTPLTRKSRFGYKIY